MEKTNNRIETKESMQEYILGKIKRDEELTYQETTMILMNTNTGLRAMGKIYGETVEAKHLK